MKKETLNVRQGDLCLFKIDKLPEGLTETNTKILVSGSHGHHHTINKGKVYLKPVDTYVFGYLVAKDTTIDHEEHGGMKLTDGIYELRKQQEFTPAGLVPVID